jgi:hypothetical protein
MHPMTTDRPPTIIQVIWKLIWVTGKDGNLKPTKPPFRANTPNRRASSTATARDLVIGPHGGGA